MSLSPLLSVEDVATYLSVSRPTVYKLIREGDLVPVRVGERVRFEESELREYVDRNRGAKAIGAPWLRKVSGQ